MAQYDAILDFDQPLDVNLFNSVIAMIYDANSNHAQRSQAQQLIMQFKNHPSAWSRADLLLEQGSPQSKYFALQILEELVKYKWKVVPEDHRVQIKGYIVNKIISLSSTEQSLRDHKILLSKLNLVLVEVIKQQWPRSWASFIPEICGASKTNESLCENNMEVLRLLSDEVFTYGTGTMTSAKALELKSTFAAQFSMVFELCEFVLERSQKVTLLRATLVTLGRFIGWIPESYIFEGRLLETLVGKFHVPPFRNPVLQALVEIAQLDTGPQHLPRYGQLLVAFMNELQSRVMPAPDTLSTVYETSSADDQQFCNQLCLFLTTLFRTRITDFEGQPQLHQYLVSAHHYLTAITEVDEREIFKVCLEYWGFLASNLYHSASFKGVAAPGLLVGPNVGRLERYAPLLSCVRRALITRMAKPEEVLIVEDENGDVIREFQQDTDSIILYQQMREALVFLTHLDSADTQKILLELLGRISSGAAWSFRNLNTLCWAIGSISGAQSEESEKLFLIAVIKDLLSMCENKRGKTNKAVVASNIMYVVGQYPRFLRAHWRFLKTVVNKLFEFMHESHPGVQDMAVETFLKIARACRRKFVVVQPLESTTFVQHLVTTIDQVIRDLTPQQFQVFYEALGNMVRAEHNQVTAASLLAQAMQTPNARWTAIVESAKANPGALAVDAQIAKRIAVLLRTNRAMCSSVGHVFTAQLSGLYVDMLNVYRLYSQMINSIIARDGPRSTASSLVRSMRSVKKETLNLVRTFAQQCNDPQQMVVSLVTPLLETVLDDYKMAIPDARDPEVLALMTELTTSLSPHVIPAVPRMFSSVFESTLQMLVSNFQDYPDHRRRFYALLESIVKHAFPAVLSIAAESATHFKLIVDSIIWGFKHSEREIAEGSLRILLELWRRVKTSPPEFSSAFYQAYLLQLLHDLFFVLTDTMHKSSFKLQATMLMEIYAAVDAGQVTVPLSANQTVNNSEFVRDFTTQLLSKIPTLTPREVQAFAEQLTNVRNGPDQYKATLRDLLVSLKEFSSQDNSDLFIDEQEAHINQQNTRELERKMAVPGLIAPIQQQEYQ